MFECVSVSVIVYVWPCSMKGGNELIRVSLLRFKLRTLSCPVYPHAHSLLRCVCAAADDAIDWEVIDHVTRGVKHAQDFFKLSNIHVMPIICVQSRSPAHPIA